MTLRAITAMAHVADVRASAAWYARLGFEVEKSIEMHPGGPLRWALLASGPARLMLARATAPIDPEQQAVLFYVYCDNVAAMHARLAAGGLLVGEIERPFHNPQGEFRLVDPDGYSVWVR